MHKIQIYPEKLRKSLKYKLEKFYIFLGEDFFLSQKNQDLILYYAYKNGFLNKITVDIKHNTDWKKVFFISKKTNLFFKKNIIIVNLLINKFNITLVNQINQLSCSLHADILIILKLNHLSIVIQKTKFFYNLKNLSIVSCFTPYGRHSIHWIKHEIQEKKIDLEKQALFLLCKYYQGNTLFIYQIIDIILVTWPNICVTYYQLKKIIVNFFNFFPLHWINSILQKKEKIAINILNMLYQQKYNPLILIRSLQKDLLTIIYLKREKNINVHIYLKKYNVWNTRFKFFVNAYHTINNDILFQAIQMLVKIEINIKKYNNTSIWNQLKELTLILS